MRIDHITASIETFPFAGAFRIARGSKTHANVIRVEIRSSAIIAHAECVPYPRYGETPEGVLAEINGSIPALLETPSRERLAELLPAGAARNALDCSLWDWEAKRQNTSVEQLLDLLPLTPVTTATTISLAGAETMFADAKTKFEAGFDLIKAKVGTEDDSERIRAIRKAAPRARIILDANEGWTVENLAQQLEVAAQCNVDLIEQPLPAGQDEILGQIQRRTPICADESVHISGDLEGLRNKYDAINIKLDKTGGLTEALKLKKQAEEMGMSIMIGCMVGTSLAMAPAFLLTRGADFVDLDGPLILAKDRHPGISYDKGLMFPPEPALWG